MKKPSTEHLMVHNKRAGIFRVDEETGEVLGVSASLDSNVSAEQLINWLQVRAAQMGGDITVTVRPSKRA